MPAKKRPPPATHYAPASRILDLKVLLQTTGGLTLREIIERMSVSKSTALRYLKTLASREPLVTEEHEGRMVYRILPTAQKENVKLTTTQMLALFLSRRFFDVLRGTGISDDLDAVYAALSATLRRSDHVLSKNLDTKVFDVSVGRMRYDERLDDVDEAVTALLREETLRITHTNKKDGSLRTFDFDPYTLLFYRHALYLVGWHHEHDELRALALDAMAGVERRKGATFAYPTDYHPAKLYERRWGIFGGERTRVRLRFDADVAPFVERREWHASQEMTRDEGGAVEMTLDLDGTTELESWILGWGAKVEVIDPPPLRAKIASEVARAAARYAEPTPRSTHARAPRSVART